MTTSLTTYGSNVSAGSLTTAGQMAITTGGTDASVTTKVGTHVNYGEIYALGNTAAWAAAAVIGATPSGNGWLLDSSLLSQQQIIAGNWSPTLNLRVGAGMLTVDMYVRAWAFDTSNNSYTPIGTMLLAGQTVSTATTAYSFSATSLPAFAFSLTQRLYFDVWFNVLTNTGGGTGNTFNFRLSTSATSGVVSDMQVVTPGYVLAPSALTAYLSNAQSVTLTTGNQLYSTVGTPGSTPRDNIIGTATGYCEITARGVGAIGGGSIGVPSGHGWFLDGAQLNNQAVLAGNWAATIRLQAEQGTAQLGSLTGDLYVRAYKYTPSTNVYTQIVSMLLSAQTIGAGADFALPATSASSMTFGIGDKLYVDIWVNVTANANGGATNQAIRLQKVSNDTAHQTGLSEAAIVTPGYIQAALSTAWTAYLSNAASSNEPSANALYMTGGSPTTTTRDVIVGTASGYGELTSNGGTSGSRTDSPYGTVYYFSNNGSLLPNKVIDLLVGGNRDGSGVEAGMVPGGPIWIRLQLKWNFIETSMGVYNWASLDDAVQRCNAANILVALTIQTPPQFRCTVDFNGNTVPYDGQTYIGSLTSGINNGTTYGTISVSALGVSDTLSNGQQINLGYDTTHQEGVLVVGNYTSGATTITVTDLNGNPWKAFYSHLPSIAQSVQNAGGIYMGPSQAATFAGLMVSRYNNTTTNYLSSASQTAMYASMFQVNEDYDLQGTNLQRDVASQWFVTMWQAVGPVLRAHAYAGTRLVGPAVRFCTDDGSGGTFGLAHIENWINNLFVYTPAGSYAGAISDGHGGTLLDALDFHWYRNGSKNFPNGGDHDPATTLYNLDGSVAWPSVALELATIKQIAANNGYSNFDAWNTEIGWDVFDSGNGTTATVTEQQQADYFFGPGNAGNLTGHLGIYEQHRQNNGSHAFIWTMNSKSYEYTYTTPVSAVETKGIVQLLQNAPPPPNSTTLYKLAAYTASQSYIAALPQWAGGSGAWEASAALGAPTLRGWLLDGSTLDGQQLTLGAFAATVTLQATVSGAGSGTLVGDIWVRAYKFTDGSDGMTPVVALSLLAQTIGSTSAAYVATGTVPNLVNFVPGDKLYVDIWVNVTTNSNGNALQAIRILKISTDGVGLIGDPGASIVTAGYQLTPPPPPPRTGYTALINDVPVFVIAGTLSITGTIGKRSTASFTAYTPSGTHFPQYAQAYIADLSGNLVFAGYVTTPQETPVGYRGNLLQTITMCDKHWLADKRIIAAAYTNMTCGAIVQNILNTILASEGVTVGQIYDGIIPALTLYPSTTMYPGFNVGLVPSATFVYCTVAQALDALAKEASNSGVPYYWMIDQNAQLWFVPYTAVVNSTLVDGSQIDQVGNPPTLTRANPQYRNTQYLLGGYAQTSVQTETRVGDGNTVAWPMGYELAAAPTITVSLNGGAFTSQSVGVKGVSTGQQYYWQQNSAIITQDSGVAKLRGAPFNDVLQVVYTGQYPNVIVSSDSGQIAYQQGVDGSTGIVEQSATDATITSTSVGYNRASTLLTRYATQGMQLVFWTQQAGFVQGQLITVNLAMFGLGMAQMLIEQVDITDNDGLNIWYTITAIIGAYDVTWVDFFATLLGSSTIANSINVGLGQSVSVIVPFTATVTPAAVLNVIGHFSCPICNRTLYPQTTLYPC